MRYNFVELSTINIALVGRQPKFCKNPAFPFIFLFYFFSFWLIFFILGFLFCLMCVLSASSAIESHPKGQRQG